MPRLALVMIARNEAHCIGRCLKSAEQFVDEMIVVDTGSTDDTVSIAERMGATVRRVSWQDDFSAARNFALECSSADWNLVLDADEWIEAGGEQLRAVLVAGWPFIGLVPIASYFDLHDRVEASISWIPRILPGNVRYQGCIHEQPVSNLRRQHVQLRIGHDGYRMDKLRLKKGRNKTLLLKELEKNPLDGYLQYQLGKDYEIYEEYAGAVRHFLEALRLSQSGDSFRHDLVIRTIFSLKQANQHEQAIQLAEKEFPNWQESPDFFFCLADLMLDWAVLNPENALRELLPIVECSWKKCLEIGEQPFLSGSVKGRGSYLAAKNLAVMYENLGDPVQAAEYRQIADAMRIDGSCLV